MQTIEKIVTGILLGAVAPILCMLIGWWGTFSFLPDRLTFLAAGMGLLAGVLVDVVFLQKWVAGFYSMSLQAWMAVYLFYSTGMFGFFMGVPVFNLALAVPAGFFMGSRLARRNACQDEVRRMKRSTCVFTTGVLAVVCAASAAVALFDPYTAANLQGMLRLPFEVTRGMVVGIILVGGTALLLLQWAVTARCFSAAYARRVNAAAA